MTFCNTKKLLSLALSSLNCGLLLVENKNEFYFFVNNAFSIAIR